MKKIFLIVGVIVVIILVVFAVRFILGGPEDNWVCENSSWVKHGNPSAPMPTAPCGNQNEKPTEKITYTNATVDNIVVELPFPGAVTGKNFSVIGKARGPWFFEASFPVVVLDKDGNTLALVPAEAQPDPVTGEINWMTTEFVPFKADIKIPETYIGPATLILRKDNPSDMRQYDASISFPFTIEY